MKETVFKVVGMACSGCENRIINALKNILGVEDVVANHVTGIVRVTSKDSLSEEILKEKIEDLGYEVKED